MSASSEEPPLIAPERQGRLGNRAYPVRKNENVGFNAVTEEFEDLVKGGIIDPTKVTRTALQNAASLAGLMLTTEAMVSEVPEDNAAPAMSGGSGGMGY